LFFKFLLNFQFIELENKGSSSLGVIFTQKIETLKDIIKELKTDK